MAAEISLAAEPIMTLGTWGVPNSVVTTWIVVIIIVFGALLLRKKRLQAVQKGMQNVVEAVCEFLDTNIQNIAGSKKNARLFFPLVGSLFIFIILLNWFGLLPGVGSIGFYEIHEGREVFVPLLRAGTSDLNTTLALAIVAVIATHIFGMKHLGPGKHLGKFFINPFKRGPIMMGVGFLELFGEVSKIISFSFRLFGNIFAGEVLLIVMTGLVSFLAPVPFYFLEIFVGFIQALVFATLTLILLTMATAEHEEHEKV